MNGRGCLGKLGGRGGLGGKVAGRNGVYVGVGIVRYALGVLYRASRFAVLVLLDI